MAKDLRTFLRRLEERAPDELLRVRRPVSVDLELTGVLRKLQSEQRYPAVIFERIQDKKLRVVSNLLGNTRLLAEALETTPEELTRTYIEREDARMAVKEVSDAPVQEVVITGADVDLHEMPIVVNCGKDSGQFISAGVTTVRVPEAGNHNSGIYRAQIHSRNRLGMSYEKHTHIGTVHRADVGVLLVAHPEPVARVDLGAVDAGVVVAGLGHPHGGDPGADELAGVLAAVHHDRHLVEVDVGAGDHHLLDGGVRDLLDRHAGVLALDVGPRQLLRRRLQRLGQQARVAQQVADDPQLLV